MLITRLWSGVLDICSVPASAFIQSGILHLIQYELSSC